MQWIAESRGELPPVRSRILPAFSSPADFENGAPGYVVVVRMAPACAHSDSMIRSGSPPAFRRLDRPARRPPGRRASHDRCDVLEALLAEELRGAQRAHARPGRSSETGRSRGISSRRVARSAWGRLTAPGTWPWAYSSGSRTSSTQRVRRPRRQRRHVDLRHVRAGRQHRPGHVGQRRGWSPRWRSCSAGGPGRRR